MSIRESFPNSVDLAVINEFDQGAAMEISTVLEILTTGPLSKSLATGKETELEKASLIDISNLGTAS